MPLETNLITDHTGQFTENEAHQHQHTVAETGLECALADALKTLRDLLEEYAPAWYTREQHEKAGAALRLFEDR